MIKLFWIKGGLIPLQTIIPWHSKDIHNIRSKNILFLSQIVATDTLMIDVLLSARLNYKSIQIISSLYYTA
ncbi:5396_t:CDS:2, partial [Funneliformis geosporum]